MTYSNRPVWAASLALVVLCLLAAWHWRGRLFPPEQGLVIRNEQGPNVLPSTSTPPPVLRPTGTPVEVKDAKTISIPVIWIGEPSQSQPDVPLVNLDGTDAQVIGKLNSGAVELPLPPDGEYRFDFAAVEIFSVAHQINVVNGQVQVLAAFTFIDKKLPVARAVRVHIEATLEGVARADPVPMHWYPLAWPRQQSDGSVLQRPEQRVTLVMNQAMDQLVPAAGIGFQLDTKEFTVKKPRPPEFATPKRGDLLRIELEGLIPLIVDLDEETPGAWIETLKRSGLEASRSNPGSRYVVVEAHAVDLAGGRLPDVRGDGMFERLPKDLKSTGGVVDSFTIKVPRPQHDATVHAMLRVYGLTYVASGEVAAGPYSSEIRLTARLFPLCSLSVTVKDSNGAILPDIPVAVDLGYVMKTGAHAIAYRKGSTNSAGAVLFTELPSGEQIFADVMVSTDFRVASGNQRVKLTPGKNHDVVIVLETGEDKILRVRVFRSASAPGASLVVLEGDGNGAWFRTMDQQIPSGASQSMFRVRANSVMVVGKSGNCYFSAAIRLDDADNTIQFNLDDAAEIRGRVMGCDGASLYPYDLSPSVIWGDARGHSMLPVVEVGQNGEFEFHLVPSASGSIWHVAKRSGEVFAGAALRPSPGKGERLELQVEHVAGSTLGTTLDVEKLAGAKSVALVICPVFVEDGRTLDAQLRLSFQLEVKGRKAPDVSLPLGRYVAFLTWADEKGVQRFGTGPGMYAQFESRMGLRTELHLPIR